jgi:hypothetical protein
MIFISKPIFNILNYIDTLKIQKEHLKNYNWSENMSWSEGYLAFPMIKIDKDAA